MNLPPVPAEVTAEAVAALPARLRNRLDAMLEQARSWPVDRDGDVISVRPDDQTTVTLSEPVGSAGHVVCSCLLAPRCLHRAAVLSMAPIHTDDGAEPAPVAECRSPAGTSEADTPGGTTDAAPASHTAGLPAPGRGDNADAPGRTGGTTRTGRTDEAVPPSREGATVQADPVDGVAGVITGAPRSAMEVTEPQRRAALDLAAAASAILTTGIPGGGALAQADLLRAAHQARATRLHAPSAAAVRLVEHLRAARREDPAFRLAGLTDDLRELLTLCHRVAARDGTAVGVARRDYEPVGDLRLHGLFCEPVRAATGHAGAATYLVDAGGRIWTVSDVKPADPAAAVSATRASVELGEVRLSHHELARVGLLAVNAHASTAGRLSHGRARRAVAASGSGWFDPPLGRLWQVSLAAQVDRWLAAGALPAHERSAAHDLAFLDGVILGADRRGLWLAISEAPPHADRSFERPDDPVEITSTPTRANARATENSATGAPAGIVTVIAPLDDPALPYVANLRLLATHAAGHRVRLAGRFIGARKVAGLAFAASWLPARYGGHVDLGTAPLNRADVPGRSEPSGPPGAPLVPVPPAGSERPAATATPDGPPQHPLAPVPPAEFGRPTATATPDDPPQHPLAPVPPAGSGRPTATATPDGPPQHPLAPVPPAGSGRPAATATPDDPPLHLLRHQLERVAAAGRTALLTGVGDDARRLADAHLGTAAAVLSELGAAGVRRTRDVFGRLDPHDVRQLAQAWLTAAVYEEAASRETTRTAWAGRPL